MGSGVGGGVGGGGVARVSDIIIIAAPVSSRTFVVWIVVGVGGRWG